MNRQKQQQKLSISKNNGPFFVCVHNVKVQKTSHVVYVSAKRFQYRVEMCVYFSTFYVNPCFCIARKQHKAKIDKCEFDAFTKCGLPIFLSRIRYLSLSLCLSSTEFYRNHFVNSEIHKRDSKSERDIYTSHRRYFPNQPRVYKSWQHVKLN